MTTKLKDILLYSLAIIGTASLFISASNQSTSPNPTTPESHVWEMFNGNGTYLFNKVSGEVRKYDGQFIELNKKGEVEDIKAKSYTIMVEVK
ncbi:hypothetical protein FORMB_08270 [Formosa sp. Hel1_33_131]|uniref:hypothetical protein n=1 Tax=Formosa sp. Hel1_33_131 TaxID=1336794 RepID=UPI00084E1ECE|nr:hypothetical protein [Formosa sp. Hel1_33_131]AOR27878.1 hypothetical protein FORMB_08270 [Formosa sp. Hel1_33_131]